MPELQEKIPVLDETNNRFTLEYKKYYTIINNVLYVKTQNRDDAADLTHNVFITYLKNMEKIEEGKTKPWLFTVLHNELRHYYRDVKGIKEADIDKVIYDDNLLYVNGFRESRIIIQEAIESLEREDDRNVFELIANDWYTQNETALALGLTRHQVRDRYNRAVRTILNYLSEKKE